MTGRQKRVVNFGEPGKILGEKAQGCLSFQTSGFRPAQQPAQPTPKLAPSESQSATAMPAMPLVIVALPTP